MTPLSRRSASRIHRPAMRAKEIARRRAARGLGVLMRPFWLNGRRSEGRPPAPAANPGPPVQVRCRTNTPSARESAEGEKASAVGLTPILQSGRVSEGIHDFPRDRDDEANPTLILRSGRGLSTGFLTIKEECVSRRRLNRGTQIVPRLSIGDEAEAFRVGADRRILPLLPKEGPGKTAPPMREGLAHENHGGPCGIRTTRVPVRSPDEMPGPGSRRRPEPGSPWAVRGRPGPAQTR